MCACGNATPTSLASTRVFDVIKISNVKLLVDFIFVRRGIIRDIPLYGISEVIGKFARCLRRHLVMKTGEIFM